MTEVEKYEKMRDVFSALISDYENENLPMSAHFVKRAMTYLSPLDYARLYDLATKPNGAQNDNL